MSKEHVKDFIAKVSKDEKLRKSYGELVKEISAAKLTEEQAYPKLMGFAKKHGAEFSLEDLKGALKSMNSDELNDEQLESVAGGKAQLNWIAIGTTQDAKDSTTSCCLIVGFRG